MAAATILILAAIRPELAPTVRRLGLRWRGTPRATGEVNGRPVLAALTGMGGQCAGRTLDELLAAHHVERIIHLGFAGGLNPALRVGDVIEPTMFRHGHEVPLSATADRITGPGLLTLDAPVLTPRDKARWHDRSHADAVDMETYHVRQRLTGTGIAYVALRAITDGCDDAVPPAAMDWIDAYGRPRVGRVLLDLLRRPTLARDLRRMQRAARRAGSALAEHVQRHLEHAAPSPRS